VTPVEQTQNEKQKDKVSGLGITKEVVGFYALPTRSHGFGVFYPIVNEMRMLAATADKARSLEPVKIALAFEGMEFEVFSGGQGYMRKDDHHFFQPMYISLFGELTNAEPVRREKHGLRLEGGRDH
jgi:hypothetical protein